MDGDRKGEGFGVVGWCWRDEKVGVFLS